MHLVLAAFIIVACFLAGAWWAAWAFFFWTLRHPAVGLALCCIALMFFAKG